MSKSSMYSQFELNNNLVEGGVDTDYGSFKVRLAHSGKANKKYQSAIEIALKPLRRAIEQGLVGEERSKAILYPIYAKVIIKGWWVNKGVDSNNETIWEEGIEARDGSVMEFNVPNVVSTLNSLPNLFDDFKNVSDSSEQYRLSDLKDDAKN